MAESSKGSNFNTLSPLALCLNGWLHMTDSYLFLDLLVVPLHVYNTSTKCTFASTSRLATLVFEAVSPASITAARMSTQS